MQILREIKNGKFRVSKSAILTNSEALNLDFCEFLHFLKAKIEQEIKIKSFQNFKNGIFETSRNSQIDLT